MAAKSETAMIMNRVGVADGVEPTWNNGSVSVARGSLARREEGRLASAIALLVSHQYSSWDTVSGGDGVQSVRRMGKKGSEIVCEKKGQCTEEK